MYFRDHEMSKEKVNQRDDNEDPRQKSISNNPCSLCRALGLPVCKGHGGGSGGGGGGSDSKGTGQQAEPQIQSGAMPLALKPQNDALFDLLGQSPLWSQVDEFIFQYKNPYALLSMTLDMENNTLICRGRDDLTQEEQYALDMLFKSLEQELNLFKQEFSATRPMQVSMSRVGNQMTINIPDPKCFDAFIQRLVDKNLLLIQPGPEQKWTKTIDEVEAPQSGQPASSWTAPTPFALTPKPEK